MASTAIASSDDQGVKQEIAINTKDDINAFLLSATGEAEGSDEAASPMLREDDDDD